MKARIILLTIGMAMVALVSFSLQAQEKTNAQQKDDIIASEQQLARQFADFQDALLKLQQRMSRGDAKDRERAKVLAVILEECKSLAINQEFTKMLEILRTVNLKSTGDTAAAAEQSDRLTQRLRTILDMLQNSKLDLSADRKKLADIIANLQKAIDQQNQVRAQTELGKTEVDGLKKDQEGATKKTKDVAEQINKFLNKDGKGGEAANLKGSSKEGKGEGAKGEAKNAGEQKGNEAARGEARDGGNKDPKTGGAKGETKPGEKGKENAKSGDNEPKSGAKPGGEKGKDGPPQTGAKPNDKGNAKGGEGSAKENKGDKSAKGGEGGAKDAGDKKGDPKSGEPGAAKPGGGEKKPSDSKSPDSSAKPGGGDPKGGGGDQPKVGGPKTPDSGDAKAGDSKGGDAKGGDGGGQGDSKPGDSKDGQGVAKDGGGPAAGGGGGSPPPGGSAKDSPPPGGGGQPPPPGGDQDEVAKSGKKIEEAGYDQKIAEDKIPQKQNDAAAKAQGDAIKKMEDAKKKLEKLLQQMREEEIERVLAALQARCEKMYIMQVEVLAGTEDLHKVILNNADKQATRANKDAANKLADKEKLIVVEADKCIDILQSEGTAVAFPEVFQQIRQDMLHVQKRLELTDVADVTQGIEKDIIATLKEMIDALKKAREENQEPSDSKPGKGGKGGKPGDQKLLELLQELKMVRSLQARVNNRTVDYAKRFPGQEQTGDPQVVRELRSLAERQLRIQQIVADIAKGANK